MTDVLEAGVRALGLMVSPEQLDQLREYGDLLLKWNRVYNLTSIREPRDVQTLHLLDCLATIPCIQREAPEAPDLLDVGSGGGLPGTVLAVMFPDRRVDCIDTVGKKAAFITQTAAALGLRNLRGVHGRVEEHRRSYSLVTSRAFSSVRQFCELSSHCLSDGGLWMAMKGRWPAEELEPLPLDVELFHVEQLRVPDLLAERHLLWLRKRRSS